jgi:hypothetical protein
VGVRTIFAVSRCHLPNSQAEDTRADPHASS